MTVSFHLFPPLFSVGICVHWKRMKIYSQYSVKGPEILLTITSKNEETSYLYLGKLPLLPAREET